jgi:hypothetical protein
VDYSNWWLGVFSERPQKSAELNLFAQLCGVQSIDNNIYDLYNALRACISLGERGFAPALALLNIMLGGSVAVPDAVSAIPPGYLKYLKRISLVNEVYIEELFPDIPFPYKHAFFRKSEDKEGKPVKISAERFPKAFGVYIEYEYPDLATGEHVVNKELWIVYYAGTGDYPYKVFLAPTAVAEKASRLLKEVEAEHLEKPISEILDEVEKLLKKHAYTEISPEMLPPGVRIESVEADEEFTEFPRSRRRLRPHSQPPPSP